MAVDFRKPAHIVVVHGVQTGEDEGIDSDDRIRTLINQSLADIHVEKEFLVKGYFYEDINNEAQKLFNYIARAITANKPLATKALKFVIDTAGDVITAAKNTSTAHRIRKGLKDEILKSYRSKNQVIVVAHSLGTIYALDVINDLIGNGHYFKGDNRSTWPVQGYVSMGSPLGLAMNIGGIEIFRKRTIRSIRDSKYSLFPWYNYYNRLDPVVSGSVFGKPCDIDGVKGPVEERYGASVKASNWLLRGHPVTSGDQWLAAHVAYWSKPMIGDRLVDLLTRN